MGTTGTSTFAITSTTSVLKLDEQGRGSLSFTVTNTSGTNLSTRASIKFDDKSNAGWFKLNGKDSRDMPVDGTDEYSISAHVPLLAKGQSPVDHWLKLRVVDVTAPEERGSESDQHKFTQTADPGGGGGFPFLWLIIPAAVLVLAAAGFGAWRIFIYKPAVPVVPSAVVIVTSQGSTDFPTTQVKLASSASLIKFLNSGTKDAHLKASITGANPADFEISVDTCTTALLVINGTCEIHVAFSPTSEGSKTANLAFTVDSGKAPAPLILTGTGQGVSSVCFTPAPLNLSITYLYFIANPPTATQATLTVNACGSAPVTIQGAALVGDASSLTHFSIGANGCAGQTLQPGDKCTLVVTFNATINYQWAVVLDVSDNVSGSPQQVPVVGVRSAYHPICLTCTLQPIPRS